MTIAKRLTHNQVRYTLLPILALALVHFVSYRKLPFEEGYQFPLATFSSVLLICIICCEANNFSYNRLRERWSLKLQPVATMLKQLGTSLALTTVVFASMVYSLNYLFFGHVTPFTRFLSSLFVALLIILVETLIFIVRDLKRVNEQPNGTAEANQVWVYQSGNKTLRTPKEAIAYIYSQSGLVYIVTQAGEKQLTQFSSINELIEANDISGFFRLNRQFMVSTAAVREIQKEVNQKLRVSLQPAILSIPKEAIVSRYNSTEFKKWVQS
ncbi:MAG: LytTR family transcriptional regulator [Roseivirga sp.]|nr:LytTR family transcriptional regulator [Roseivirga sp.]